MLVTLTYKECNLGISKTTRRKRKLQPKRHQLQRRRAKPRRLLQMGRAVPVVEQVKRSSTLTLTQMVMPRTMRRMDMTVRMFCQPV